MEQLHWKDFPEILYLGFTQIALENIQVLFQTGQKQDRQCT
jgi:hypothetical protein